MLVSCGEANFAKRRYTKGVYIEKRSRGVASKIKSKKEESHSQGRESNLNKKINQSSIEIETIRAQNDLTEIQKVQNRKEQPDLVEDEVDEELKYVSENKIAPPPELDDGEILTKSKRRNDPLGKASGILGFTGLGLFVLTLLISFILWMVAYFGTISLNFTGIVFTFMFYISMALGLAALITGAISFSKTRNQLALAGIIIGAIFATILFISLLVLFLT